MNKAFTLAEVLITLAIIGIVAVLTIPSLNNEYQKRVLTTQLQKSVAVLSQAGAMALADEMGEDFRRSKTLREGNFLDKFVKGESGSYERFFASTYNYYNDKNATYYGLDNLSGNYTCRKTSSGATVCIDEYGIGFMDINGDKGPNLVGRDAFQIGFNADGTLATDYSSALNSIVQHDWDIDNPDWHSDGKVKEEKTNSTGKKKVAVKKQKS